MLCSRARTALSARLDGEDLPGGVTERRLREHLDGCTGCRAWEERALRLQAAVAGALADGDEAADGTETASGEGPAGPVESAAQAPAASSRPRGGSIDDPGSASGSAPGSPGRRAC